MRGMERRDCCYYRNYRNSLFPTTPYKIDAQREVYRGGCLAREKREGEVRLVEQLRQCWVAELTY